MLHDRSGRGDFTLAGAAHRDRTARIDGRDAMGRSNPGTWTECFGGAAWNVAVDLAALGRKPMLHTVLGMDAADFAKVADGFGLTLEAQRGLAQTASYSAIVDRSGDLLLAVADMEIYREFSPEDVPACPTLVVDANLEPEAIEELSATAETVVALAVSAAKAERLLPAIENINVLFANASEVDAMGGLDRLAAVIPLIISSDGSHPLRVTEHGTALTFPVPPCTIAGDVVGAGDALVAGFLHLWADGRAVEDCARFGVACAQAILAVNGPARHDLLQAANESMTR